MGEISHPNFLEKEGYHVQIMNLPISEIGRETLEYQAALNKARRAKKGM